jgi:hypothetical protein
MERCRTGLPAGRSADLAPMVSTTLIALPPRSLNARHSFITAWQTASVTSIAAAPTGSASRLISGARWPPPNRGRACRRSYSPSERPEMVRLGARPAGTDGRWGVRHLKLGCDQWSWEGVRQGQHVVGGLANGAQDAAVLGREGLDQLLAKVRRRQFIDFLWHTFRQVSRRRSFCRSNDGADLRTCPRLRSGDCIDHKASLFGQPREYNVGPAVLEPRDYSAAEEKPLSRVA